MKSTVNSPAHNVPREFEIGDIVIDHNDGHIVLVTDSSQGDSFNGVTLVGAGSFATASICTDIVIDTFNLFVGTITLEN